MTAARCHRLSVRAAHQPRANSHSTAAEDWVASGPVPRSTMLVRVSKPSPSSNAGRANGCRRSNRFTGGIASSTATRTSRCSSASTNQ